MAGYGRRTGSSTGIHDDLTAGALVVSDGIRKAAIVSVELLALGIRICDSIAEQVAAHTDIPPEAVMVCATHTHSGPHFNIFATPRGDSPDAPGRDLNWERGLPDRIARAVIEANAHLRPAAVAAAGAQFGLGTNRRLMRADGTIQLAPNYAGTVDHELKVLGLFLLAYLVTAFAVSEPWGEILKRSFIPHIELTTTFLFLIVGTFGTTITAYCWFWQSDQEVEEQLADRMIGPDGAVDQQRLGPFLKRVKTDTKIGTAWAEVVQWAIIVVCATVLFGHGVTNITTASQAASALKPLAGAYAKDLFAIGVIGVGLMAIPIFAGVSAYAMCELNGWSKGLNRNVKDARPFYAVIVVSTLIAEVMNFVGIDMIKALVWTAVLWGFVAVPLLFAIARLNSDPKVLGDHRGTRGSRIWVWITFGVMTASAGALLVSLL